MKTRSKNSWKAGMTLVEIMVSIVILAVLAIGGASAAHMSRRTIVVQRNRREALGIAHKRLERLRAIHYDDLAPTTLDYTEYYVVENLSGDLLVQDSDPDETVVIHGLDIPIETRLQYVDVDGGAVSFDGMFLSVSVGYHEKETDRVELETFYANSGEFE